MKCAVCAYRSTATSASLCKSCLREFTKQAVYRSACKPLPPLVEAGSLRKGDVFYGVTAGTRIVHDGRHAATSVIRTLINGQPNCIGESAHVIPVCAVEQLLSDEEGAQ